jgi:hypothetical protein
LELLSNICFLKNVGFREGARRFPFTPPACISTKSWRMERWMEKMKKEKQGGDQ